MYILAKVTINSEVHAREPIDWFVYSSAIAKEQADAPEMRFAKSMAFAPQNVMSSDELLKTTTKTYRHCRHSRPKPRLPPWHLAV